MMLHLELEPGPTNLDRPSLVRDGLAVLALVLAALCAIVLVLPAEGRIAEPLHAALGALLGQAAFMLPVGLCIGGVLLLAHSVRPELPWPRGRLLGLGVLSVCVVAAQDHLAPHGGGLIGAWLSSQLDDWLGSPASLSLILCGLLVGTLLTFGIGPREVLRWPRSRLLLRLRHRPPRPRRPEHEDEHAAG